MGEEPTHETQIVKCGVGRCLESFDMIERLKTLRELQFPVTIKCKGLFSHVAHLHTLHLMQRSGLDGAGLNTLLTNPPLENIRVLTLIAFHKLNYSTMKRILLKFPLLQMLSLRFTYFAEDIEGLKERIVTDSAFVRREEGWLGRITFDRDVEAVLRTPSQIGKVRYSLYTYDGTTRKDKRSVADLHQTYGE